MWSRSREVTIIEITYFSKIKLMQSKKVMIVLFRLVKITYYLFSSMTDVMYNFFGNMGITRPFPNSAVHKM